MNEIVEQFMKVIRKAEMPATKAEAVGLQEVQELPEEEDCEYTTRFSTKNLRGASCATKENLHCLSASMVVQHLRCISTKLRAKHLPEEEEDILNTRNNSSHKIASAYGKRSHVANKFKKYNLSPPLTSCPVMRIPIEMISPFEDTNAVLECLSKHTYSRVEYIIDDIGLDSSKKGKVSHSLVMPHQSDEPAIDSEEKDAQQPVTDNATATETRTSTFTATATAATVFD